MPRTIILNGDGLTISQVVSFAEKQGAKIALDESVASAVERSERFLHDHLTDRIIYGVNTGFGPMSSHLIGKKELVALQYNLIISHAVGMGAPIPSPYVLAAMLVRLNTLAKGYSGVSMELVEHLRSVLNHRVIPEIPEHGAVGTSGDLVQLAHIALALIGKGYAVYKDERMPTHRAFDSAGLSAYELKPKEGLSLINGTSVMSGITALACAHTDRLLGLAARTGAWALELIGGFDDSIEQRFHEFRPHRGQSAVAQTLRELTAGSRLTKRRDKFQSKHKITDRTRLIDDEVQEIYSFRCIPQLLGPMLDSLVQARGIVEMEMNSVTDNPIVDAEREHFWHGGHFHGEYIAMASDQLRANISKLALLSERRINFFLNEKTNKGLLPPFLNMVKPGLTLALQGLQFVATSTAAGTQTLAYPHRIHSISTNGDNQDVVSMGTDSALLTMKVIDDAYVLLAIELITLAQATDVLRTRRRLSPAAQRLFEAVRDRMKPIKQDRELVDELSSVVELARTDRVVPLTWHVSSRTRLFS